MTRDNIVYTTCGLLLGLIIGSFLIGPKLAKTKLAGSSDAAAADVAPAATSSAMPAANQMEMVRKQLDDLKQRVAANPNDVEALVQLGNMYADVAKYPQAIEYYEKALIVRDDVNVRTDLGIAYKEAGRLDDALAQFRRISDAAPDSWQALYNLIIIEGQMKRFDAARADLAKLKKLRPNDPQVAQVEQALAAQR